MTDNLQTIWLIEGQESLNSRALLYGDGLFETFVVEQGGYIRWLDTHIRRFKASGLKLGYPPQFLEKGILAIRNCQDKKPGIWRMTISRPASDDIPMGGNEGLIALHYRPYHIVESIRLKIMPGFYFPHDELATYKSTSYLRHIEAKRRAMACGFDEALLVSEQQHIGETSTASVICVLDHKKLVTPPLRGILNSVTRQHVLEYLYAERMDIQERPIDLDELENCTEIILLSSVLGAKAASAVDSKVLQSLWAPKIQQFIQSQNK